MFLGRDRKPFRSEPDRKHQNSTSYEAIHFNCRHLGREKLVDLVNTGLQSDFVYFSLRVHENAKSWKKLQNLVRYREKQYKRYCISFVTRHIYVMTRTLWFSCVNIYGNFLIIAGSRSLVIKILISIKIGLAFVKIPYVQGQNVYSIFTA
jgi:hypothetical protein